MSWAKSSRSDGQTGNCVEVWRKSSRSPHELTACVEVAQLAGAVGVRDSKDQDGPVLEFGPDSWRQFLAGMKSGEFDI